MDLVGYRQRGRHLKIEGLSVETIVAGDTEKQARALVSLITRMIVDEAVAPHEIAVLLCASRSKAVFEGAINDYPLPKGARFGRLENYGHGIVTVETVARFKGLERAIVILWALDECTASRDREILYVGMSRAKAALFICGTIETCLRLGFIG